MSCQGATSPINIGTDHTATCKLKCDYTFAYNNSDSTATNRGGYISMTYDRASNPQVTYNTKKYNVQEIRLYQPSLHSYGGRKAAAEMIIFHTGNSGSLLVCVPVVASPGQTTSNAMFSLIMPRIKKYAARAGDSAQLGVDRFNLSDIVPIKPFYSYQGTLPYTPCNGVHSFVVFDLNNGGMANMNGEDMTALQNMISAAPSRLATNNPYYYNPGGPSKTLASADDIYIDCQPTGEDGQTLIQTPSDPAGGAAFSGETVKKILANPLTIMVLMGLAMYTIIKLGQFIFSKITERRAIKKAAAHAIKSGAAATAVAAAKKAVASAKTVTSK
jgi:carbonic anhydrase